MEPLKEIPLEDICKENPLVDQFIWPDKLNFVTLSYYCEIVEGDYLNYKQVGKLLLRKTLLCENQINIVE